MQVRSEESFPLSFSPCKYKNALAFRGTGAVRPDPKMVEPAHIQARKPRHPTVNSVDEHKLDVRPILAPTCKAETLRGIRTAGEGADRLQPWNTGSEFILCGRMWLNDKARGECATDECERDEGVGEGRGASVQTGVLGSQRPRRMNLLTKLCYEYSKWSKWSC